MNYNSCFTSKTIGIGIQINLNSYRSKIRRDRVRKTEVNMFISFSIASLETPVVPIYLAVAIVT